MAEVKRIPKWRVGRIPTVGTIIRDYLVERKRAFPYEVWKHYISWLKGEFPGILPKKKREFVYHIPTYDSFYRYFYILEELKVIRRGEFERGEAPIPRQYYEIVPGAEDSPVWAKRNIQNYLYPITRVGKHVYNTLLKPEAEKRGITPLIAFAEVPEEYEDIAEDMELDVGIMKENLLKLHRTVPSVRKEKRRDEIIELRMTLDECERELEELKKAKPPVKIPPPKPKIPERLARAIDSFIRTMEAIKETKNIKAFGEILAQTAMIIKEWGKIDDENKKRICEAIFSMPTEALRIKEEYPLFGKLIDKCREFLG